MNYEKLYKDMKKAVSNRIPEMETVFNQAEDYQKELDVLETAKNKNDQVEQEATPADAAIDFNKKMAAMAASTRKLK